MGDVGECFFKFGQGFKWQLEIETMKPLQEGYKSI